MDLNCEDLDFMDGDEEQIRLFNLAANYFQAQASQGKLSDNILLQLYGLYKSATVGKCNEPAPSFFNRKAKAKWQAWQDASPFSKATARQNYIDLVKSTFNWKEEMSTDAKSSVGGGFKNTVSTFARDPLDDKPSEPEEDNVFKWAKDNDMKAMRLWFNQGNKSNLVNEQDEDGLTPLHWAVDRGHIDACLLLLDHGADPTKCDNDDQTPLDYAITCEHDKIVALLQRRTRNLC